MSSIHLANAEERSAAVANAERITAALEGVSTLDATNALAVALSAITMMRFPDRRDRQSRERWVDGLARAVKETMKGHEGAL